MLKRFKQLDRKTKQMMLARLTADLLPNPGVQIEERDFEMDQSAYENVRKEIHEFLKINPQDLSPENRSRVFEFLGKQMSDTTLAGADINSIKKRIGNRGELRKDLYEVKFLKSFEMSEALGVRRNHVLEALRNPDGIEHLDLKQISIEDYGLLSLYQRDDSNQNDRDRFSLLVLTRRLGYLQQVVAAYRIYHSDVGISGIQNPLDVFRTFLNVYGTELGYMRTKLIMDEVVDVSYKEGIGELIKTPFFNPDLWISPIIILRKSNLSNIYVVALTFILDWEKYATGLRHHNVNVIKKKFDKDNVIIDLSIPSIYN